MRPAAQSVAGPVLSFPPSLHTACPNCAPRKLSQVKLSVGVTCHPCLLEIEGLFTEGWRRSRVYLLKDPTFGESVGGIFEMVSSDWSNGIRYHNFDTRSDHSLSYHGEDSMTLARGGGEDGEDREEAGHGYPHPLTPPAVPYQFPRQSSPSLGHCYPLTPPAVAHQFPRQSTASLISPGAVMSAAAPDSPEAGASSTIQLNLSQF